MIADLNNLTFGTELEYDQINRETAARAIQSVTGGTINHIADNYDTWTVTAPDGRVWKAVADASIGNRYSSAEVVTPVLKIEDMETLQAVVRALRRAGAKANATTGQHVHVGMAGFAPRQIANLVRLFYKQETLILKAVGTLANRLTYTKPADREFIARLERAKPQSIADLNAAWFGYHVAHVTHYNSHRYRALNLNNLFGGTKGTVEFRCFNSTTHAGEVKANILLCLALAAKARTASSASSRNPRPYNEASAKYDMRVFLLRLGMIGDAFKAARLHLLKRMPGSAAWKNGRRAS